MALLPILCVARFSRTDLSMLVARALKIGKIADGGMPPTYETMHWGMAVKEVTSRRQLGRVDGEIISHSFSAATCN
jgi:hypothetical protein